MKKGKPMKKVAIVLLIALFGSVVYYMSGTGFWAKTLGGTITIKLSNGQKLVNATWKDSNLWVLSRDRKPGETVEKYTFQERSNLGIIEGTVLIEELP